MIIKFTENDRSVIKKNWHTLIVSGISAKTHKNDMHQKALISNVRTFQNEKIEFSEK